MDLFPLVSVHVQYIERDSKEDGWGFLSSCFFPC